MEEENIFSVRRQCLDERKTIFSEISQHKQFLAKARRYLLAGKIDFEDFRDTKKEHNQIMHNLNDRLQHLTRKLSIDNSEHADIWSDNGINIFQFYNIQDFVGKRYIASMFIPSEIDIFERNFRSIQINPTLKK